MKKENLDKIIDKVRSYLSEQPTNNVGGGQIAGTVEAGDDPPVKKKRKKRKNRYIYQKGVRKLWTPEDGGRS